MAVAPQFSAFEILDLRLLHPRSLAALFEEQQRLWGEQLHWDYRPSVEMIRKHVEARSLPGYVALCRGQVVGYCFFVYEDERGLLGDLYVLEEHRRERPLGTPAGIATLLLEHALETLLQSPVVRRIEAQLIPFGTEPLGPVFLAHNFRSFPRLFMYKQLNRGGSSPRRPAEQKERRGTGAGLKPARFAGAAAAGAVPGGSPMRGTAGAAELRLWVDSDFEAMADLIVAAYRGHIDSEINNHYHTRSGALRFLKNIVLFPGCGIFQLDCSLVAVDATHPAPSAPRTRLMGGVLSSQVASRVGHITQICVRPEWKGQGLGRHLMQAALERLRAKGYRGVSLTVTAENQAAVKLYRQLGFEVIKEFSAFARTLR